MFLNVFEKKKKMTNNYFLERSSDPLYAFKIPLYLTN
jgi:hypothetical protein